MSLRWTLVAISNILAEVYIRDSQTDIYQFYLWVGLIGLKVFEQLRPIFAIWKISACSNKNHTSWSGWYFDTSKYSPNIKYVRFYTHNSIFISVIWYNLSTNLKYINFFICSHLLIIYTKKLCRDAQKIESICIWRKYVMI